VVRPESRFLVDTAFIVERAHKMFSGTALLTTDANDHSFTFGFARDFLRLRNSLGIRVGVLVFASEVHSQTTDQNLEDVVSFLEELAIPYIYDRANAGLKIAASLRSQFSHVVSNNEQFLQLTDDEHTVVLIRHNSLHPCEWMSPEAVRTAMGIAPTAVPTYLALTSAPKWDALTNRQAVRLIELYGNLDSIYENLPNLPSGQVRRKLQESESQVRGYFAANSADRPRPLPPCEVQNWSLSDMNTERNRQCLRTRGFHSLVPLLTNPAHVLLDLNERGPRPNSYHAVVDPKGIQKLEALLLSSKLCAIDTESNDKDPRKGELLGIAFSMAGGEAYFVPLIECDLRGLQKDNVLRFLKRICESDVNFVGHNIKYDYLLLRRNGVRINSVHFDTMLAAYDCHGDWDFFNLPYLAQSFLNEKIKSYSDLLDQDSTLLDVPFEELVNHACGDADMTMRLYPILLAELSHRSITGQYHDQTMALMRYLGELEFQGVPVDSSKIDAIHRRFSLKASGLKDEICKKVGKAFDLDSEKDLSTVLKEALALRGYLAPRKITMAVLEQMATSEPIARLVVQYKRLRRRILGLQTISTSVSSGKIYPLFNQIKSRAGLLASVGPSLFESGASPHLKWCFDRKVRDYFTDRQRSLDALLHLTQDPVLQEVLKRQGKVDIFMAEQVIMKDLDHDELLLSLAVGQSDATISRVFLVDRVKVAEIRHDLGKRYQTMFGWLENYRRSAQANGYATIDGKRKYIDGLKSSDISRREKALENAVRWLIHY
jgi:DNA polymerase I